MSRLWQSIVSIWAWLVLIACVLAWLPIMALLRLVTAPFDRGHYAVGYFFRQIPVVMGPSTRSGGSGSPARCPPTLAART